VHHSPLSSFFVVMKPLKNEFLAPVWLILKPLPGGGYAPPY